MKLTFLLELLLILIIVAFAASKPIESSKPQVVSVFRQAGDTDVAAEVTNAVAPAPVKPVEEEDDDDDDDDDDEEDLFGLGGDDADEEESDEDEREEEADDDDDDDDEDEAESVGMYNFLYCGSVGVP